MKACTVCKIEKELLEFSRDSSKLDGSRCVCKVCEKEKRQTSEFKEKRKIYNKKPRVIDRTEKHRKQPKIMEKDLERRRSLKSVKRRRDINYMANYGITVDDYDRMFIEQNGLCKICRQEETAVHKKTNKLRLLSIDHCHTTGRVRGLLCGDCNRAIGIMKDDIKRLESAIKYLKDNS